MKLTITIRVTEQNNKNLKNSEKERTVCKETTVTQMADFTLLKMGS